MGGRSPRDPRQRGGGPRAWGYTMAVYFVTSEANASSRRPSCTRSWRSWRRWVSGSRRSSASRNPGCTPHAELNSPGLGAGMLDGAPCYRVGWGSRLVRATTHEPGPVSACVAGKPPPGMVDHWIAASRRGRARRALGRHGAGSSEACRAHPASPGSRGWQRRPASARWRPSRSSPPCPGAWGRR